MSPDESRKVLSVKEKKLIDNIKHARNDAGLTQEELSYKLNKNSNYMGMLESYRRSTSLKTLFKISTVLNIKLIKLFENL